MLRVRSTPPASTCAYPPSSNFIIIYLNYYSRLLTSNCSHHKYPPTASDLGIKQMGKNQNKSQESLSVAYIIKMFSKLINRGYEAEECQLCKTQFNLLKLQRIHKCKRCNKYVCWRCGNHKQKVLDDQGKWTPETHRVCNQCNSELTRIVTMVEEKKMRWGKDSLLSEEWILRMNADTSGKKVSKQKDYEYQHFLKLFNTNIKNFEEETQIIDKDVIKGRTDYIVFNYSLRQFFYTIQQNEETQKTRRNMANVLYAIAARFDQVGYVQGMSSIAAFLLCFCSEETAYIIFCDLIENILPDKFLVKGNYGMTLIGLLAETHFLKEYFVHIITKVKMPLISHYREPYTQHEIEHFRMIVELSASKALLSLFVNFLSYSHIQFIWKQFQIHRNFQVAQRAFLAILYLCRQQLIQRRSFKQLQSLFENVHFQQFTEAYYDLDIDPVIKSKLIQQFYQSLNKKWSNNSQQNIKQLHRCTNFTEEEIKLLQTKFGKNLKSKQDLSRESTKELSDKVISKDDFILLIKCYYDILKENTDQEAPILQITSYYVSKIFDTFVTKKTVNESPINKQKRQSLSPQKSGQSPTYLDFREFVCCFSMCTKSLLKDRMCSIVNTFEDRNKKISYSSFSKLIKNLCEISPLEIEDKKQAFLQRMNRYFSNQEDGITINELYILLNDNFINELTMYIRTDSPDIINKTLEKYFNISSGIDSKPIQDITPQ